MKKLLVFFLSVAFVGNSTLAWSKSPRKDRTAATKEFAEEAQEYEMSSDEADEAESVENPKDYQRYYDWCDDVIEGLSETVRNARKLEGQGKFYAAVKVFQRQLDNLPKDFPILYQKFPTYSAIVRVKRVARQVRALSDFQSNPLMARTLLDFYFSGIDLITQIHEADYSRCFRECDDTPYISFVDEQLELLSKRIIWKDRNGVSVPRPFGEPEVYLIAAKVFLQGIKKDFALDLDVSEAQCSVRKVNRILSLINDDRGLDSVTWFEEVAIAIYNLGYDSNDWGCF